MGPGVSKVGSYTGNGSSTGPTVDCGFSSGPRFVMIKRADNSGSWYVFDGTRGIVAGNDPYLYFNASAVQYSAVGIYEADLTPDWAIFELFLWLDASKTLASDCRIYRHSSDRFLAQILV